jgi:hypothetical protein
MSWPEEMSEDERLNFLDVVLRAEAARNIEAAAAEAKFEWVDIVGEIAQAHLLEMQHLAVIVYDLILDGLSEPAIVVDQLGFPTDFENALLAEIERREPGARDDDAEPRGDDDELPF